MVRKTISPTVGDMKITSILTVALAALILLGAASSQAALTVTNGVMTNGGALTGLTGWSNNQSGAMEGKIDTLAGGANDDFGALVFSDSSVTVGTTDNDWAGLEAGHTLTLNFELFNERLVEANGATDILAELLIDGAVKTSVTLLRANETFDNTQTRTPYATPEYAIAAGDIGKQVDVRFTATAANVAWHQTGIDNVTIAADLSPTFTINEILLDPAKTYPTPQDPIVISSASIGDLVGMLRSKTATGGVVPGVTYSLSVGLGDTNNASYAIGGVNGDELLVQGTLTGLDDAPHSVRIKAQNVDSTFEMALSFLVKADSEPDGLIDDWELMFGSLGDFASGGDFDNDNLNDEDEYAAGTDPTDDDSDNDTWSDGDEVAAGTDPKNGLDFPQPPLTLLNGMMINGNVINGLTNWSNSASGGLEGKNDSLAGGANDDFGALVFSTTTGATNNNWTGVVAGQMIALNFELFNERLVDGNGATDMLTELIIDGAVKSSIALLRSTEIFDETQTRTPYSAPDYAIDASDLGKQVDVRFTATAADAAWHQTGIDNVAITFAESAAPFVITDISLTPDGPVITFNSTLGAKYNIERSTNLMSWPEIADEYPAAGAAGTSTSFTDMSLATDFLGGAPNIYYRVRKLP